MIFFKNQLPGIIDDAVAAVSDVVDSVASAANSVANAVAGMVSDIADAVSSIANNIANSVEETVQNISDALGNVARDVQKKIADLLGGLGIDTPLGTAFHNPLASPLVVDLDGDGIELTALDGSSTFFDLNVDGFAEHTGWVQSDDGLLAFDVDGNGTIDDNSELFGNMTGFDNGFLQLAQHDSNGDGVIDANDDQFDNMLVWRDFDQDGVSDEGELQTLSEAGITSIDLNSVTVHETNTGHDVTDRSSVTFSDGTSGLIEDIHFENSTASSVTLLPDDFEYSSEALLHPALWGYGNIPSTWTSLTLDSNLLAQSADLVDGLKQGDLSNFRADFEAFLFSWAGVADVAPDSRGHLIDGRHVAFLEKVYGTDFVTVDGGSVINALAARDLDALYEQYLEMLAGRFIAQSAGASSILSAESLEDAATAIAAHPLSSFAGLTADYSPQNRALDGDLTEVVSGLQVSVDSGAITAANAYLALGFLHQDLSDSEEEFNQMLLDAAVAAGLTLHDELFAVIEALGDVDVIYGTDGSDSVSATEASHIEAGAGDDTVNGSDEDDYINGGQGNDVLAGGRGTDSYLFKEGEGDDIIDERGTRTENDKLYFAAGIAIDNLYSHFTQTGGDGNIYDFTIGLKNGDGSVTILDDGSDSIYADYQHIQEFVFSDGTTLTRNEFRLATMGTDGDDHFDGSGEDDDYIFRGGEGNDTIYENANQDNDRLVFADGITIEDLYSVNANTGGSSSLYDFTIGLKNGDGTITILDDANASIYGDKQQVNEFVFSDGTTLSRNEFRLTTMGTDSDDHFAGSGESDDYVFRGGEGNDTIRETIAASGQETENDRLVFGEGITVDDLYSINTHTGGDSSDHDFTIGLKNGDGTITILDTGRDNNLAEAHQIDQFVFDDGTVLSRNEFRVATMGTDGDDHFDGSGMDDDYVFRGGAGNDTIQESYQYDNDRLIFGAGIDQADVFSFRSDVNADGVDDLVIGVDGMAGSITISSNYASSNPDPYQLDEFVFEDGTTLNYDAFLASTFDQDQANGFFL